MGSATVEKEETWEQAPSGNLPPFCILDVDDTVTGVLLERDVRLEERKTKKGGKLVNEERERIYYRFKITKESQGANGGKDSGVRVTYNPGDVVTVPGAGALNNTFNMLALKLAGKDLEGDEPSKDDYLSLYGREYQIKRLPDGVMKGGLNKGKPVKIYDVKHRKV